jgi:Phage integrase family
MVRGGLRAGEVRSLRLADVDMELRRVRVVGKGGRERVVPLDRAFFSELAAYLRIQRPAGCPTPECFIVLRGPTAGRAMTEAGMRRIFRTHRARSGATRPHRLRHIYGTRACPSRDRPAGAEGADGPGPSGDHRLLGAPVAGHTRRRVRPGPRSGKVILPSAASLRPCRDVDLVALYERHVAGLPISDSSRWARRRAARRFLERFPEMEAWMRRPTPTRLLDLNRADAWPFVVWCFVDGHLRPDVELLLAKAEGVELSLVWNAAHPGNAVRVVRLAAARVERQLDPPGLQARPAGGVPGGREGTRRARRR